VSERTCFPRVTLGVAVAHRRAYPRARVKHSVSKQISPQKARKSVLGPVFRPLVAAGYRGHFVARLPVTPVALENCTIVVAADEVRLPPIHILLGFEHRSCPTGRSRRPSRETNLASWPMGAGCTCSRRRTGDGGGDLRFKYRFDGREKSLSPGTYPDVSLKDAREKREAMRRDRAAGVDPAAKRRAEKYSSAASFEAVAREWIGRFSTNWKGSPSDKIVRRMELHIAVDRCSAHCQIELGRSAPVFAARGGRGQARDGELSAAELQSGLPPRDRDWAPRR
jgi:hypothetical protein